MARTQMHNFLVVGIDVASLVASARRAGNKVYAVDYFGDQDLKRLCSGSQSIVEQRIGKTCGRLGRDFRPEALLKLAKDLIRNVKIDALLLSSGLDDSPEILSELDDMVPILGNHPDVIGRVRDKNKFFQELEHLRIPHPKTAMVESLDETRVEAKNIGYPILVKPSRGFSGTGIRKAKSPKEIEQAFGVASMLDKKILVQEFISGTAASASLISSSKGAITVTLNEQLLGMREMAQGEPFGYCGNVVPLRVGKALKDRCKYIAEKVVSHFNLVGSNGIDFVISKEGVPYVIEVNPRFQGSLECVENILNVNIAEAHVKACVYGELPIIKKNPSAFCVRLILFAPQRSVVPDLSNFEEVRDIPLPRVIVGKGEPVCSIIIEEKTKSLALRKAKNTAKLIYEKLLGIR